MIYEVITTKQADSDLRGIYEYIAFELLSPENAAGQLDRLEQGMLKLETFPEKFRAYEKEPWHGRGLRIMPVDNYLVFYIPDKDTKIVTVLRVMYAGRDAPFAAAYEIIQKWYKKETDSAAEWKDVKPVFIKTGGY